MIVLKYLKKNYLWFQLSDKLLNLNKLHLSIPYITDSIVKSLLHHVDKLQRLCLYSFNNFKKGSETLDELKEEMTLNCQKFLQITELVNLEKLKVDNLPVNDSFIIKMIHNCSNIKEIKIGWLYFIIFNIL